MPKDSMDKKKAVKAARTAGSAAVGALSLALKIVVTALLVILTTGLLFVCIFAFAENSKDACLVLNISYIVSEGVEITF